MATDHYNDVIMGTIASQITSLMTVYSTVYSDADQRNHQSSASLAFVRGIHRGPVNSPHKWPVTRKMFPFDDVIMGSIPDFLKRDMRTARYIIKKFPEIPDVSCYTKKPWCHPVFINLGGTDHSPEDTVIQFKYCVYLQMRWIILYLHSKCQMN